MREMLLTSSALILALLVLRQVFRKRIEFLQIHDRYALHADRIIHGQILDYFMPALRIDHSQISAACFHDACLQCSI